MSRLIDSMSGFAGRTRQFVVDVVGELRKSSWPTRGELLESTLVVILSVILFSVYVGASDFVLGNVMRMLLR